MDRRMRVISALICFMIISSNHAFTPGADGPVLAQEALEGGNITLLCDSTTDTPNDELMLLVWYKDNLPVYSYDARISKEWSSTSFNSSNRLRTELQKQPTVLIITQLRGDDQALYHCRVDFLLAPTRNLGVNLSIIVLPSQPFFLDELGNKVEGKIGPYHEGDTLVLSCLVIGGRPPPRISWYAGNDLVDASDGISDIPNVRENELYLPLTRDNADSLSCRATNTDHRPPIVTTLQVELYLPAYNVSIHWVRGTVQEALLAGRRAVVQCVAQGSYPPPELSWWLDHRHLTQYSNQSWSNATRKAESFLELTPAVSDNGATLACVATNTALAPGRDSKADIVILNVTYSPIVELTKLGDRRLNEVSELDSLQLECEVRANPPVDNFTWYFNDIEIRANSLWGSDVFSQTLLVEEATRRLAGRYSCAARNSIGETRTETMNISVLYPPECMEQSLTLVKETLKCNVKALPRPDTFFWHIQALDEDIQHLTTGSPILPLTQITGSLSRTLDASCEAGNGIASQEAPCKRTFSFDLLRPPQPRQCDLAYEYEEFQMRCIPVENATYYEVSLWRKSTSNASLVLKRRGSMGYGISQALAQGDGIPWLVRGPLGNLRVGDEAGASACNRYGCSTALLLRPTDNLLNAAAPPWWKFLLERDVGISIGAVVLVAVFLLSSVLVYRVARQVRSKPTPVIQVLQLEDVHRDYLDTIGDHKVRESYSLRSCSSGYSDGSGGNAPTIDRHRKPRLWTWETPPPDVTLTLHRESAIGRSSESPIDFVVMDTVAGDKSGDTKVLQSTISRFACRILSDRNDVNNCRIYAAGFDSSRNIFLGEKATKWTENHEIDGLTTNGVLIMHPRGDFCGGSATCGPWRETSVGGAVFSLRESRSAQQKGVPCQAETNVLRDGTMIDLCGATLLWRSAEGLKNSPTKRDLEALVDELNAGRPQCPVGLNTLVIPRKLSTAHQDLNQPYVYLNCGHVQGEHSWGAEGSETGVRRCPMCLTAGPVVRVCMGIEPAFYVDSGPPTYAFNPCGHMASERTVKYWATVDIPHGTNGFHAICPFCAAPLQGSSGYVRLIFQDNLD